MATTESRSGFRLPWAGERRDEATDADLSESAAAADDATAEASLEAPTDVAENALVEPTAESTPAAESTAPAPTAPAPAATSAEPAWSPAASPPSGTGRKPTKFLADLTKAMQAAAEAERQETLELFQLEAKSHVESIHARSSTEAEDLRKRADDDIAAIRDWSKQEIARVREETENRISARKTDLTEEIDAHAARIEREIDRVHATVERFEHEMATFFENLLGESDPTRFAAMAASLPEPPAFDAATIERAAATAPPAPAPVAPPDADETPTKASDPWRDEPARTAASDVDAASHPDAASASAASADGPAPVDQEAAFAAIEAAAQAAEATETSAPETSAPETTEAAPEPEAVESPEAEGVPAPDEAPDEALADDPRLAALGIADFATAEAEASADLPSDDEPVPDIADETVAARLAGLVPDETAAAAPAEPDSSAPTSAETRVFVSGLVSVASIAGFKRHLGRTPGIQSVGVTSGPDGEFVFAVAHDPSVDVGGVVTALPGFGARVTESADGVVRATAHDPDAA
ncbi:MAG TPA: hypothetical protein VFS32_08445 [Candidatus Limnocylindrales bacterium]|nr:hypothetical protein [Candidatus Limnocylindrales bacterium]